MAEEEAPSTQHGFDPWLAQLFDWEHHPSPEMRLECARSLLRMLGTAVGNGLEIPQELRKWLGERLREAAATGNANAAFRLSPGKGKPAKFWVHMNNAAQVYAVAEWQDRKISNAATELAALPGRLDASNLEKHHRNTAQRWRIAGPFVLDANGAPTDSSATQNDLATGKAVGVLFTSKYTDSYRIVLNLPKDLADIDPPSRG